MNNTYDPMYNSNNISWRQPSWNNITNWPPRLNSNVVTVTSLEEALIKTTEHGSDIIYFHQDKNEFYRIKVDMEGRKSWAAFSYNSPSREDNTPATKADIVALAERLDTLERMFNSKQTKSPTRKTKDKEVTEDGELDG